MESRPDAMFACRTPGCYQPPGEAACVPGIDPGVALHAPGGFFNISMVNVPALLVTLPPWLVPATGLRGRGD
jgi:hypothetical protein